MKVVVFGATGTVGKHFVEQALAGGYEVTAFARRPEAIEIAHPNLSTLAGDVLDPAAVADAVNGHDAVVVALGAGRKGGVRAAGTKNIIMGMQAHGVQRLICQSTLGAGDSRPALNFVWKYIMFGMLLKDAYLDHQEQEDLVRNSGLDWTIVRPSAFTDDPATGGYLEGFAPTQKGLSLKISRADVANFLVRQLRENTYLGRAASISN